MFKFLGFGASNKPDEIIGNQEANHVIKFEYCGGWGYKTHVDDAIEKIEEQYPQKFLFKLYRDSKLTGRLEATLYLNT